MISAQDKILYVANKLGLSTLKDMQGIYRRGLRCGHRFSGQSLVMLHATQTQALPTLTNNQFEVNEALLVENISFYVKNTAGAT
jgi:hypothetical protein